MKGAQLNGKKPLFVQFVLDNIWAAYDAVVIKKDSSMIEKIIQSLGLSIPPRDLRHKDDRVLLQAVMSQWLPLSNAILDVVTTCLPSPLQISDERIQKLMCNKSQQFFSLPKETQNLKKDFEACNSSLVAPVIVYISKMFPMDKKSLPHNKARPLTAEELHLRHEEARQRLAYKQQKKQQGDKEEKKENLTSPVDINDETIARCLTNLVVSTKKAEKEENENDYMFIAIARIFSGTIRKGSTVFFLGPKHDPEKSLGELYSLSPEEFQNNPELQGKYPHITAVQINDLYLLMGRELEALEEVSAGNVLGIGGLESTVLKSGTLSSTVACPAFTDMFFDASPIVRVAVEPVNACDMGALVLGLKLLNQADPCVEVRIQETGEHVIIAAGEVHLQRCIDDIRERYGKIEVNVSKPIVPFRETVILPPKVDMVNESIQDQVNEEDKDGLILASTIDRQCHLLLRAASLPGEVADILHQNQESLKSLDSLTSYNMSNIEAAFCMTDSAKETLLAIKQKLKEEFDKAGSEWIGAENCIWCFGPRRLGPNILLNHVKHYKRPSVWHPLESNSQELCKLVELDNSVITGFQTATLAGPLCEEPMHGVCIIVEDWWFGEKTKSAYKVNPDRKLLDSEHLENKLEDSSKPLAAFPGFETVNLQNSLYGPLSGQLISTVKEGCRRAFQTQPQRLMAAMYSCEIQANIDVLGKLHGVLAKRYGKVLSDDLMEGTAIFHIKAVLPVVESFGFAEDMRKKTSGLASPQLKFSHWEVIPVDPFWVPTTEEEYMHFGEKADAENRARIYMNQVRKRKGLSTNEKIVEFAEKQRTLSKNK
ncbi:Elongation factor-like GTPase 1 [Bulinus truncatus]|nr:Elongation factor-like GTPase 1 [Bulinus truncatus]